MSQKRPELPSGDDTVADWRPTRFEKSFSKDLFYRDGASVILNRFDPGGNNFAHQHPYRQIRYILEGHMTVNGRTYGPGSIIDFPANTVYEVTCPEGGVWLVLQLKTEIGVLPPDRSGIEQKQALA